MKATRSCFTRAVILPRALSWKLSARCRLKPRRVSRSLAGAHREMRVAVLGGIVETLKSQTAASLRYLVVRRDEVHSFIVGDPLHLAAYHRPAALHGPAAVGRIHVVDGSVGY